MKKLAITLFLLMGTLLNAQILEEETKVLDEPSGEPLFKLNSELAVYTFEPENGWYKCRREAWVGLADLPDEKYLYPGTVLKNKEGVKIGEVLKEIKIKDKRKVDGFRGEDRYIVILEGYIFKTKIKNGTSPEERVTELLAIKNRTQQYAGFEELFTLYDFEEREFEDLTAHVMREKHKTAQEEKDFRMIIIFRGETSVYAVITNDHGNVTAPKIKEESDDPPFHVIYLYKPPASQKDLVENTILYTFLGL
ncbi:MAG: hypothetical protein ACPF9D_04915 [Owenweeksia sp.]